MTGCADRDWDPGAYGRFRGFRLRPALDLLAQVPEGLCDGDIVDLGCGAGAVAPALAARFSDRRRIGVDHAPAMLREAAKTRAYTQLVTAGIENWSPDRPPALIFSNAALNWVPNHAALLPRLRDLLAPCGVLAVQMPDQQDAPSHRLLRNVSADLFPDRFHWKTWAPEVLAPARIVDLLDREGDIALWQTVYHQILPPDDDAHPVRTFTQSTVARPVLARLDPAERSRFLAAYDAALGAAYPPRKDGSVLFPFTRLFFVLTKSI